MSRRIQIVNKIVEVNKLIYNIFSYSQKVLFCNNLNLHLKIGNGQRKRWFTETQQFQGFEHAEVSEPGIESTSDFADP
jgi:hypothetical protein